MGEKQKSDEDTLLRMSQVLQKTFELYIEINMDTLSYRQLSAGEVQLYDGSVQGDYRSAFEQLCRNEVNEKDVPGIRRILSPEALKEACANTAGSSQISFHYRLRNTVPEKTMQGTVTLLKDMNPQYVILLIQDITDVGELFMGLSEASGNVYLFEKDMETGISRWSESAVNYFGLPADYTTKTTEIWLQHIHPDDREAYLDDLNKVFAGKKERHYTQYRAMNAAGDYVWLECSGKILYNKNSKPDSFVGLMNRIDNPSKYDPVTKCLSTQQFYHRELDRDCVLMILGMDQFRSVIHNYGYDEGNDILLSLGNLLKEIASECNVYRMTGDEFLIVLPEYEKETAELLFQNCQIQFQAVCDENENWKHIRFSGGATSFHPGKIDKNTAIKQLEHSLEEAKRQGKGQYVWFSAEIAEKHLRKQKIRQELTNAIEHNFDGFELYYQPVRNIHLSRISGAEALLRFHAPDLGMLSPEEFIPVLEETREIRSVGLWVMEEAIRQKKKWIDRYPGLSIGINASYLQLYDDTFFQRMIETAARYQVDPRYIVVELTESCKVQYPESLAAMFEKIMQKGFRVALDDFGVENSSLTLVRDLPVNLIKVDHSFVRTLSMDRGKKTQANLAIISSINYLCKQLGVSVIVEGVESREIAELLAEMDIDFLQGYYYSKPLPVAEFERLIEASSDSGDMAKSGKTV